MARVLLLAGILGIAAGIRPPAVPLSANHPFFSIWSASDNLYDAPTVWGPNGDVTEMAGMVAVDGVAYRYMGGADLKREIFPNTSFPYFAFDSSTDVATAALCENWCNGTHNCLSWSFQYIDKNSTNCLLNKMVGPAVTQANFTSGTIARPYYLPNSPVVQESVQVTPLQTIYSFRVGSAVRFTVTFVTAHIPDDWETMARPVTYIIFSATSHGALMCWLGNCNATCRQFGRFRVACAPVHVQMASHTA